jgi:hypothetical protein
MYDTAEKKECVLKRGKRGLIIAGICSAFVPLLLFIMWLGKWSA